MRQYEYGMLYSTDRMYGLEYEFNGTTYKDKDLLSVLNILGDSGWQLITREGNKYILMRQRIPQGRQNL